jgi:prepilin-type N-terminal cleavage/methylation domain-containing protein
MVSLKKQKGFTIVELLIVIIIIGILATLVITTFSGIQAKARDSKRQTDIQAVDAQLEAFFAQNAYYPSLFDLQLPTFVSSNLKGLDSSALTDPKGSTITGNAPVAGTYVYSYVTTGCTTTTASSSSNACVSFVLTAELESGGTYFKKSTT